MSESSDSPRTSELISVVTLDGPSSSGKSTVARNVAKTLRFIHLNSGALFRAIGVLAVRANVDTADDDALAKFAKAIQFRFELCPDNSTRFTADGVDITGEIFTREAGRLASLVAVHPKLRAVLTDVQRRIGEEGGVVVEGRDSGTAAFPNARWKFYLDAPAEVRAQRRLAELTAKGETDFAAESEEARLAEIVADFEERDRRDKTRAVAPLMVAEHATVIDTAGRSIEEIVSQIVEKVGSTT